MQEHIINKVFVEITTNDTKVAYKLKDNIGTFLTDNIFPYVEDYFSSLENSLPFGIVRIPKLTLEFAASSKNNFVELKDGIANEVVKEIQKIIAAPAQRDQKADFINKQESKIKAFLFFLEEGIAPWWFPTKNKLSFHKKEILEIVKSSNFEKRFRQKIENTRIQDRLINQFSDEEIHLLLHYTFCDGGEVNSVIDNKTPKLIKDLNVLDRTMVWKKTINYLISGNTQKLKGKFNQIINNEAKEVSKTITSLKDVTLAILHSLKKSGTVEKTYDHDLELELNQTQFQNLNEVLLQEGITLNDDNDYYVENAGLLLLHPFLKLFFENCKLLGKENTIKNNALAVHLLHYVATKKEKQLEINMIFEKFLCGVSIKKSIPRNIVLSKHLKAQTEKFLQAVIQNWGVLKNSSPDLLRNEFLQRPGKLILKGDNPKLIVERKTQDILLDKLPWNISVFKLPWIEKLVFADW